MFELRVAIHEQTTLVIGAGTIFRLVEQKLVKNEKQSRQSNSEYNFMHYVFFKKLYKVYNGVWDKAPRSWGVFCFCVFKITLQFVR